MLFLVGRRIRLLSRRVFRLLLGFVQRNLRCSIPDILVERFLVRVAHVCSLRRVIVQQFGIYESASAHRPCISVIVLTLVLIVRLVVLRKVFRKAE